MQSILQYRRVEKQLRRQIAQHGLEKTASAIPRPATSEPSEADNKDGPRQSDRLEHKPLPEINAGASPQDTALQEKDTIEPLAPADSNLSGATTRGSSVSETRHANDLGDPTGLEKTGTSLGHALTGVNVRSHTAKRAGVDRGKVFVVGFAGEKDPLNPHNWSFRRRGVTTLLITLIGLIVGFASSVDSAVIPQAAKEFGVSEVTESLATGLYLVGFGSGAFFAAPISETVGRNPVYIVTMSLFMICIMASGLAPNIGAQLVFRILAGFFGATPLVCAGGSLSDMWNAKERTAVFPVFANSAFWGPILGPIIGGFIGQSHVVGWRWVEWVTLIWSGPILALLVLFLPETYAPTLLKWKAEKLRKVTGDRRYMSELEVQDTKFRDRLVHNLYRPFLLFVFEPTCVLFTLYLTVIYIILFTFLTGYSFIFTDIFGLGQGDTFLCFVGIGIGFFACSALVPWVYQRYARMTAEAVERGEKGLEPEQRLVFAMLGAPFIPISLFWMGWTAYPSLTLWPALVSTVFTGFAILAIFISTYQYLIDTYEATAASALVGATFVRYVVAGGMIEVSLPMYENLGVHWTLTVLACIGLLMAPVPYIFFKYGKSIRKRSRYAPAGKN